MKKTNKYIAALILNTLFLTGLKWEKIVWSDYLLIVMVVFSLCWFVFAEEFAAWCNRKFKRNNKG